MRVFLSSTYVDLIEYRKVAADALDRLGQKVGRMEVFGARPTEPSESCLTEIEACDLFVGIYAHRYGYVPAGSDFSITEIEFQHAKTLSKPIFGFVIDEDHPWTPKMIEDEPGKTKLRELKRDVATGRIKETFTTAPDLALKIATSLGHYLSQPLSPRRDPGLQNDSDLPRALDRLVLGLLSATHDLQQRLYNFVGRYGYVYIDAENPKDNLTPSTLYRVGQYLAWVVIWKNNQAAAESVLGPKADEIFSKMGEISQGFSSDKAFHSQILRIFRDVQTELGEYLVEGEGHQQLCISRSGFNVRLGEQAVRDAFEPIRRDIISLRKEIVERHIDRLILLQNKLIDLLDLLDPEHARIKADERERLSS